jgi:hypothetical protein
VWRLGFAAAFACTFIHPAPAYAHGVCGHDRTDDTLRPVPASLVTAVAVAFGVHLREGAGGGMTPAELAQQTAIRCDRGEILACMAGANLNCGQADTRRVSPGGNAWCRDHPDADFVPMFATGHETIYAWRCAGTRAVPEHQAQAMDARGFVAGFWRRLNA